MSDTYTKLFSSITESTVWGEPYATRVVWVAMLAMADAQGRVYGSVPGLARRANVTLDEAVAALAAFMGPDPYSRTPDSDGRRVEKAEGGWLLLNHAKYSQIRNAEERKEYKREWARKQRDGKSDVDSVDTCGHAWTNVDSVDRVGHTNTNTNTREEDGVSASADMFPADAGNDPAAEQGEQPNGRPPCPQQQIVNLYHQLLPELRQMREWNETRRRLLGRRWSESQERQTLDWWAAFFGYVRRSPFLMGKTIGRDGRPFDCDLEWLIRPNNFAKVVEGKYEDAAA